MAEKTQDEVMKEVDKAATDANDLMGKDGDGEAYVTARRRKYVLLPASLADVPKINKLLMQYEVLTKQTPKDGDGVFSEGLSDLMAQIIFYAVKDAQPNITKEQILKDFALSDFPVMMQKVLTLNDFFQRTREMMVTKKTVEMAITR